MGKVDSHAGGDAKVKFWVPPGSNLLHDSFFPVIARGGRKVRTTSLVFLVPSLEADNLVRESERYAESM